MSKPTTPGHVDMAFQAPSVLDVRADLTINGSGVEPLMVGPAELARLFKLSTRVLRRMRAKKLLPEPDLHLSARCLRWSVEGVRAWIEAGCPPSEKWMVAKGKEKNR